MLSKELAFVSIVQPHLSITLMGYVRTSENSSYLLNSTSGTPFSGLVDAIVINQILTGVRPAFENTPVEFRTLIKGAWSDDTKMRPKAAQMACVLSN